MATSTELVLESHIGGFGSTKQRDIPVIDFSGFDSARHDEISEQIWDAAKNVGFFQLKNHGIPNELIDLAFTDSKGFFDLPNSTKQKWKLGNNVGWEYMSQVRPSTGTQDQKESYQITLPRMQGYFPTEEELPGFRTKMENFEKLNWGLAQKVLSVFESRLGLSENHLKQAHDRESSRYQSTLRLLHYFKLSPEELDSSKWRAGAHTDFTTLTLLHQRDNQGGLEVCPGFDVGSEAWTPVKPMNYVITCNIGDMLMRWSDDVLKSTLHRVRSPTYNGNEEHLKARYSVVYFAQANEDAILQGPKSKYPEITAGEFIKERLRANYEALSKLK